MIKELRFYLAKTNPLAAKKYEFHKLPHGQYHLNYKIIADGRPYVFRLSVMQLSRKRHQIRDEFQTLQYLEKHALAPKTFFLDLHSFTYPLMIEEFVQGKLLRTLSPSNLSKVAWIIAALNKIPLKKTIRLPSLNQTMLEIFSITLPFSTR